MTTNNYKYLLIEKRDKLQIIKFNNPKRKNAFNKETYLEIIHALESAARDDSVTVVALTGVGDYYTSGNDLSTATALQDDENLDDMLAKAVENVMKFVKTFIEFPKILIAVVNGPCLGIGATTAALCDVIYCSDTAYFYTPFTKLGLCPEGCSSYTFPKIFGTSKASELLLLDAKLSAEDALKFNFVSEVFKTNELDSKIWPKIEGFSKLPPGSLKVGKELIRKLDKEDLVKAMKFEGDALQQRWSSEECFNAITSFLTEKAKSKL